MSNLYPSNNTGIRILNPGNGRPAPEMQQSDLSRILPRQLSTGSTRGTQTVGYGNTKIDGSNNTIRVGDSILLDGNSGTITVTNDDGSTLGMGPIPGTANEFGFYTLDDQGRLVIKIVNGTLYVYDGDLDRMQAGILPDATINVAISKEGQSVSDAYGS